MREKTALQAIIVRYSRCTWESTAKDILRINKQRAKPWSKTRSNIRVGQGGGCDGPNYKTSGSSLKKKHLLKFMDFSISKIRAFAEPMNYQAFMKICSNKTSTQ